MCVKEGEQLSAYYKEMLSAWALRLLSSPPFREGVDVSMYVTSLGEFTVMLKFFLGAGPCDLALPPLQTAELEASMGAVGMPWLPTMLGCGVAQTLCDLVPGSSWTSLRWPKGGKRVAVAVSSGYHTKSLQRR